MHQRCTRKHTHNPWDEQNFCHSQLESLQWLGGFLSAQVFLHSTKCNMEGHRACHHLMSLLQSFAMGTHVPSKG